MASKAFKANDNQVVNSDGGRTNKTVINLSKNNKSKNLTYIASIRVIKKSTFLTSNAKKAFNHL